MLPNSTLKNSKIISYFWQDAGYKTMFLLAFVYCAVLYVLFRNPPSLSYADDVNSIGSYDGFIKHITHFYYRNNGRLGLHIIRALIAKLTFLFNVSPFSFPWFQLSVFSYLIAILGIIITIHGISRKLGYSQKYFLLVSGFGFAYCALNAVFIKVIFTVSLAGITYVLPVFLFSIVLKKVFSNGKLTFLHMALYFIACLCSEQLFMVSFFIITAFVFFELIDKESVKKPLFFLWLSSLSITCLAGLIFTLSPGQRHRNTIILSKHISIHRWLSTTMEYCENLFLVNKSIIAIVFVAIFIFFLRLTCSAAIRRSWSRIGAKCFWAAIFILAGFCGTLPLVISWHLPEYAFFFPSILILTGLGIALDIMVNDVLCRRINLPSKLALSLAVVFLLLIGARNLPIALETVSREVAIREARFKTYSKIISSAAGTGSFFINGSTFNFDAPWGIITSEAIQPNIILDKQFGLENYNLVDCEYVVPKLRRAFSMAGYLLPFRSAIAIDPADYLKNKRRCGVLSYDFPLYNDFAYCRAIITFKPNVAGYSSLIYDLHFTRDFAGILQLRARPVEISPTSSPLPLYVDFFTVDSNGLPAEIKYDSLPDRKYYAWVENLHKSPGFLRVAIRKFPIAAIHNKDIKITLVNIR
jgi:hypothetical protein